MYESVVVSNGGNAKYRKEWDGKDAIKRGERSTLPRRYNTNRLIPTFF
jgi:hypothetical protein